MTSKINKEVANSKSQESKVDIAKNNKDLKDVKEFKDNKDGNMNEITEDANNVLNTNNDDFNFENNIDDDYLNDDIKEVSFIR